MAKKNTLTFTVELDENNLPTNIEWNGEESSEEELVHSEGEDEDSDEDSDETPKKKPKAIRDLELLDEYKKHFRFEYVSETVEKGVVPRLVARLLDSIASARAAPL